MPLGLLVSMVIVGIAGIAMLLHFFGLSKPAQIDSDARAITAWLREFPEDTPVGVTLCQDHSAALIETVNGYGIVWPMGADTTARFLTGARITQSRTGLRINLPDYAAPRITLALAGNEASDWANRLAEPT